MKLAAVTQSLMRFPARAVTALQRVSALWLIPVAWMIGGAVMLATIAAKRWDLPQEAEVVAVIPPPRPEQDKKNGGSSDTPKSPPVDAPRGGVVGQTMARGVDATTGAASGLFTYFVMQGGAGGGSGGVTGGSSGADSGRTRKSEKTTATPTITPPGTSANGYRAGRRGAYPNGSTDQGPSSRRAAPVTPFSFSPGGHRGGVPANPITARIPMTPIDPSAGRRGEHAETTGSISPSRPGQRTPSVTVVETPYRFQRGAAPQNGFNPSVGAVLGARPGRDGGGLRGGYHGGGGFRGGGRH